MATSVNDTTSQAKVGLLFIVGDLISNEQRNEILPLISKALTQIDKKKFAEIETLLNDLIPTTQFQTDSQYRQISNTDHGSLAGFFYLPNFHTVSNVLKDYLTSCSRLSIVFLGQQIDANGALILADSAFTADHLHHLFQENSFSTVQDLQLIFPFVSHQWTRLSTHYLQKHVKHVQLLDLSTDLEQENNFGEGFSQRLGEILSQDTTDFDIYRKLIPRDSAGAIAFDEPNLYILYGQQGEASLFGIRGFVVLVNGGFSRMPSYWNLIRGLQNIDACILTHFDHGVLPGLQTLLHRKTIPISDDGRLCKPDIGAIFLNQTQRTRLQSSPSAKRTTNSKLSVNPSQNIEQFSNDIKKLNIDTFDLIRHITPSKPSIEPINLYKKIAFGSLDLYVLHPTTLSTDDEKILANVQKIPIRDQQPTSSIIPLHHWYSSCTLLVWSPTSKSSKETVVRILYTGACPQTLVFEALTRARHLDLLHESVHPRTASGKTITTSSSSTTIKHPSPKAKAPSPETTTKPPTRSIPTKPKPRPAPVGKKVTGVSAPTVNKAKTNPTGSVPTSKRSSVTSQPNEDEVKSETPSDGQESTQDEIQEQESTGELLSNNADVSRENGIKRPGSVLLSNDSHEPFVESTTATPIDDLSSHFLSNDPMTISFVDGAPNTRNPFLEKPSHDNGDIDIVHHTISAGHKSAMPSIDEINLQGLPMDGDSQAKKATSKKTINGAHRSSVPTIPTNHLRKGKATAMSGPVFYVDVAYIPYHGNEHYVDSEFFRRIRARYYVLNAVEISRLTLESLLDGKQQWEKQEHIPVTLVPTFDGDQLRQFFVMNKARLAELNINILPASTRCNVQYDDEGSPAQRLRFSAHPHQHVNE